MKEGAPSKASSNFLAPDALLMMTIGGMLDIGGGSICLLLILGVITAPVGLLISTILDIVGLILFSAWTLFLRSGTISGKSVKVIWKLLKRAGLPFLVESIPIFGDVAFSWILTVYLEVKNG